MPRHTIQFAFEEEKATQAAAHFLRLADGRMRYLHLLKLLYLAERESLQNFSQPISGDRYVAMKHGPVLSTVYNLLKGEIEGSGYWENHIGERSGYFVELKNDPGAGALSESEVKVLNDVWEFCLKWDQWRLRDFTHSLPEWRNPGATSITIPVESILRALQKPASEIEAVRKLAAEKTHFDTLFGN